MTGQRIPPRPRNKRDQPIRKGKMINGFEASDAIKAVQNWALDNPDFDTSFVDSLAEGLEKFGSLTERQESALSNIISRFEIDIPSNV